MAKFKLFSKNKKEEGNDTPITEENVATREAAEEGETAEAAETAAGEEEAAAPISIATISHTGYYDAVTLLEQACSVKYWHDIEMDEEDLPETEDALLLAFRPASGKRGFEYRIGAFDPAASGWKEIHYTGPTAGEFDLDQSFVERRLEQLQERLPDVPDFSLIKNAYINGFGEGFRQMKQKVLADRWHSVDNILKEMRDLSEDLMAAVEENGEIHFEVVDQDVFTGDKIDSKYLAWANIEPFSSIMDQV